MLCPTFTPLGWGVWVQQVPVLQDIPCQVLARAPGVDRAGELVTWGGTGGERVPPVPSCPCQWQGGQVGPILTATMSPALRCPAPLKQWRLRAMLACRRFAVHSSSEGG